MEQIKRIFNVEECKKLTLDEFLKVHEGFDEFQKIKNLGGLKKIYQKINPKKKTERDTE